MDYLVGSVHFQVGHRSSKAKTMPCLVLAALTHSRMISDFKGWSSVFRKSCEMDSMKEKLLSTAPEEWMHGGRVIVKPCPTTVRRDMHQKMCGVQACSQLGWRDSSIVKCIYSKIHRSHPIGPKLLAPCTGFTGSLWSVRAECVACSHWWRQRNTLCGKARSLSGRKWVLNCFKSPGFLRLLWLPFSLFCCLGNVYSPAWLPGSFSWVLTASVFHSWSSSCSSSPETC